ncbi:hypothetical protein BpHYR1_037419 [Brachionus plicatilis]|uniref:Uncharacterized protein n=1 Tax=Brachionus plicatilis TaxID=10195 RepID=A0A3M7PFW2_BRAPC|nr:hypothetical protein BpHYR1_037419 [Brachionus plicatilis]
MYKLVLNCTNLHYLFYFFRTNLKYFKGIVLVDLKIIFSLFSVLVKILVKAYFLIGRYSSYLERQKSCRDPDWRYPVPASLYGSLV